MKFLISRKRVIRDTIILDVPVPEFMQGTTAAKEMAVKCFAESWKDGWKEETSETITMEIRPVGDEEPTANELKPEQPTVIVQPVITHIVRRTSKLERWREHNKLNGFLFQRSGWLERTISA